MTKVVQAIRKIARRRSQKSHSIPLWLRHVQVRCEHAFWLCDIVSADSLVPTFLLEAKSDIALALYAAVLGNDKTVYLHLRSCLENVVRHVYYAAQPGRFVATQLEQAAPYVRIREMWEYVLPLPHFCTATGGRGTFDLKQAWNRAYSGASGVVHGTTFTDRRLHVGIQEIQLSAQRAQQLDDYVAKSFFPTMYAILSLYHIGAYSLISQPLRRSLLSQLHAVPLRQILASFSELPLQWACLQKATAMETRRRRRKSRHSRTGILRHGNEVALAILMPRVPEDESGEKK